MTNPSASSCLIPAPSFWLYDWNVGAMKNRRLSVGRMDADGGQNIPHCFSSTGEPGPVDRLDTPRSVNTAAHRAGSVWRTVFSVWTIVPPWAACLVDRATCYLTFLYLRAMALWRCQASDLMDCPHRPSLNDRKVLIQVNQTGRTDLRLSRLPLISASAYWPNPNSQIPNLRVHSAPFCHRRWLARSMTEIWIFKIYKHISIHWFIRPLGHYMIVLYVHYVCLVMWPHCWSTSTNWYSSCLINTYIQQGEIYYHLEYQEWTCLNLTPRADWRIIWWSFE